MALPAARAARSLPRQSSSRLSVRLPENSSSSVRGGTTQSILPRTPASVSGSPGPTRARPPHLASKGTTEPTPTSSLSWFKTPPKKTPAPNAARFDFGTRQNRRHPSDGRFSPGFPQEIIAPGAISESASGLEGGSITRSLPVEEELTDPALDSTWATETCIQDDHLTRKLKRKGKEIDGTKSSYGSSRSTPQSLRRFDGSYANRLTQPVAKLKSGPRLIEKVSHDVYIPSNITVANLSRLLGVPHKSLLRRMKAMEMEITDSNHMLTSDEAYILALEFDRNPIIDDAAAFDLYPLRLPDDQSKLSLKPPVITIMGHVDHGKTTLLDTLRSTSVASDEAGGITQHIGAFSVPVPSLSRTIAPSIEYRSFSDLTPRTITFLDTPGHAAFSAMRARGASVTDIIVLVVAADDGVMPQTKEVIKLATASVSSDGDYASGIGLVVALNKIDKPDADADSVKRALFAEGVQLEDFGGNVPCVEVSGLTGLGLEKLVETLSTLAEIKELRARAAGPAEGRVLESRVDKGRGPIATVLVTHGVLITGSHIVAGTSWARVRQMTDSSGKTVQSVSAGMPVTVSGWKELPQAGDEMLEGKENEVKAAVFNRKRKLGLETLALDVKSINEKRTKEKEREAEVAFAITNISSRSSKRTTIAPSPALMPDISVETTGAEELRLIIKADVSGSAEAVTAALQDIGNHVAKVKIISTSVGEPSEADVDMARAVSATLIVFNVKVANKILNHAERSGVSVISNSIIYRLLEEVRTRVQALLPPIIEQRVLGEAIVQLLFDIKGKGKSIIKIAGCRVTNGIIVKAKRIRIVRDGEEVYSGSLGTLRHHKKDVEEARKGSECGMGFDNFTAFQEGDKIQSYEEIQKPGLL